MYSAMLPRILSPCCLLINRNSPSQLPELLKPAVVGSCSGAHLLLPSPWKHLKPRASESRPWEVPMSFEKGRHLWLDIFHTALADSYFLSLTTWQRLSNLTFPPSYYKNWKVFFFKKFPTIKLQYCLQCFYKLPAHYIIPPTEGGSGTPPAPPGRAVLELRTTSTAHSLPIPTSCTLYPFLEMFFV